MGIGAKAIHKMAENGILAEIQLKQVRHQMAIACIEFGYLAAQRGITYEDALQEYLATINKAR